MGNTLAKQVSIGLMGWSAEIGSEDDCRLQGHSEYWEEDGRSAA